MNNNKILNSWKDISEYLGREIRTLYKWEKEHGLPVHRIDTDSSRSRVFAYAEELDKWLEERSQNNNFQKTIGRKKLLILTGFSFVLITIIIFVVLLATHTINLAPSSKRPTIAVIPLVSSGSLEHEEYFAEGLTNYLINQLINLNTYNVFPATMTENFKNTQEDIEKIKKELEPKYILSGTLEKNGENLRLNLQFLKAKSNSVNWDINIEESENNISDFLNRLQDELYGNFAKKGKSRRILLPSRDSEFSRSTYDIFLKGNYILNKIKIDNGDPWEVYYQGKYYSNLSARESNELAIRLFSKAIEIDSQFALAYFALAQCYTNYINFAWENKIEWLEKAESLVKKANAISPELPEYYSNLTRIYLLYYEAFKKDTKDLAYGVSEEGIKRYPYDSSLNALVGYCYLLKYGSRGNEVDFKKALDHCERGYLVNPYSISHIFYVELLILNGDFHKALEICNQIDKFTLFNMVEGYKGDIYYLMGELDKSQQILHARPAALSTELFYQNILGKIAARRGKVSETLKIIENLKVIAVDEQQFTRRDLNFASMYFGIGEYDLGLKYLKSFFSYPEIVERRFRYIKEIEFDGNFDKARQDERFIEEIEKIRTITN